MYLRTFLWFISLRFIGSGFCEKAESKEHPEMMIRIIAFNLTALKCKDLNIMPLNHIAHFRLDVYPVMIREAA